MEGSLNSKCLSTDADLDNGTSDFEASVHSFREHMLLKIKHWSTRSYLPDLTIVPFVLHHSFGDTSFIHLTSIQPAPAPAPAPHLSTPNDVATLTHAHVVVSFCRIFGFQAMAVKYFDARTRFGCGVSL